MWLSSYCCPVRQRHACGLSSAVSSRDRFGGVKDSGYGRFGGKAAIAEFTELRWITIQSGHRHYPF